jgi:beta-galactosidase
LWSIATPVLYRAEIDLMVGGRTVDQAATPFGIRKVEVDVERGLRVNGEPVKLKGGCLHHDNGLLGSAAIDRAAERRVELMKANGFNAIRTSHNPPSPKFLETCDRLGMLVMDDAFDCWQAQKNPQDYSLLRRLV